MPEPKIKAGTLVRIVGSNHRPPIGHFVGRVGKAEHHSSNDPDGCYVRFDDRSYMFCFYDELERA